MSKIKGKTQKTITFLWGLPGSGKSYYAESFKSQSYVKVIDVDKIYKKNPGDSLNLLAKAIATACATKKYKEIIIDSLLTTNSQARAIFDCLNEHLSEYKLLYKIVYWKEDREACLHNDKGRRKQNSEITIKNSPFEIPDCNILTEVNPNKGITVKKVVQKQPRMAILNVAEELGFKTKNPKSTYFYQEHSIDGIMLKSREWSEGGTSGNCYDDHITTFSGDEPLDSFEEFDKLLEKVCPNIGFLQYKKLYAQCCKLQRREMGDYYGGSSKYAQYVCDLSQLNTALKEMGYLKDE